MVLGEGLEEGGRRAVWMLDAVSKLDAASMLQSSVDMVAKAASGQVSPSAVFADMGQLVLDARRAALTPIRGDLTGALGLLFTTGFLSFL